MCRSSRVSFTAARAAVESLVQNMAAAGGDLH
jgi:hypothetical protein